MSINEIIELLHLSVYGEVALQGNASKNATNRLRKRKLIKVSEETGRYVLTESGNALVDRVRAVAS